MPPFDSLRLKTYIHNKSIIELFYKKIKWDNGTYLTTIWVKNKIEEPIMTQSKSLLALLFIKCMYVGSYFIKPALYAKYVDQPLYPRGMSKIARIGCGPTASAVLSYKASPRIPVVSIILPPTAFVASRLA